MYKNRVKKWVGMIFLLAICTVFSLNTDVYATCKTDDAKSHYGVRYTIDTNKNGNKIKDIKLNVQNGEFYIKLLKESEVSNSDIKNTAKDIIANDNIPVINKDNPLTSSKPYTITLTEMKKYARSGANDLVVVVFTKGDKKSSIECGKTAYRMMFSVGDDDGVVVQGNVPSIYYNTNICKEARKMYASQHQNKDLHTIIGDALTPCTTSNPDHLIPYNISYRTLESIFKKVKELVDTYNDNQTKILIENQLPALDSSWKKVDKTNFNSDKNKYYGNNKEMLTCDAKDAKTMNRFFYEETSQGEATIKNKNGDRKVTACETTCREQVEVNYGPPKAVVAGQCFTYEVEIKSKVVCNAKLNIDSGNFPKYADYAPCQVTAYCSNSSGYGEQAGPKEDFDKCVSSCDGGKYTQSCIDSCYDKVYNKKNTKSKSKTSTKKVNNFETYTQNTLKLTNRNNSKVKKVNNVYESQAATCPSISQGSVSAEDIVKVYNYVNGNIVGRYTNSGDQLVYTPVGYDNEKNTYVDVGHNNAQCEWAQYGSSYFRNIAITARTVCNAKGLDWDERYPNQCAGDNHAQCYNTDTCYPGIRRQGGYYNVTYSASPEGFKRSSVCKQTCSWINTGYRIDGTPDSNCYVDRVQAESDYQTSIQSYVSAIQSCINKATSCVQNEEKSVYTMVANTDTKNGKEKQTCDQNFNEGNQKDNCLSWTKRPTKNTLLDNREAIDNKTENSNTILKLIGGSCTGENDREWIYHSIITFPGAWINNKNGEISYNKKDERYYKHYAGNYCTPLNAKNVNANWWTWYQYTKSGKTKKSFTDWATNKNLVYNIFSQIKKFGLYNWSMDIGCFYAINNETIPTIPTDDPENPPENPDNPPSPCNNTNCPPGGETTNKTETTTDFDNFTTKSISTTTMFPSTKTSTKSTDKANVKKLSYTNKLANTQKMANSQTRTEGFNWSVEATNLSIDGYPVTPSALVKKIESGNTYDESELDYHITLSKKQIANIKNDLKDYTDFKGKYTDKTVDESYKTKYINAGYTESGIPSITFFKSTEVLRDSKYVTKHKLPGEDGLMCNNIKNNNSCDITLGGYTSQDEELQQWLGNIK